MNTIDADDWWLSKSKYTYKNFDVSDVMVFYEKDNIKEFIYLERPKFAYDNKLQIAIINNKISYVEYLFETKYYKTSDQDILDMVFDYLVMNKDNMNDTNKYKFMSLLMTMVANK